MFKVGTKVVRVRKKVGGLPVGNQGESDLSRYIVIEVLGGWMISYHLVRA